MNEQSMNKLSDITCKLNSLVSVLCGYCENFSENSREISDLVDFSVILKGIVRELYDII